VRLGARGRRGVVCCRACVRNLVLWGWTVYVVGALTGLNGSGRLSVFVVELVGAAGCQACRAGLGGNIVADPPTPVYEELPGLPGLSASWNTTTAHRVSETHPRRYGNQDCSFPLGMTRAIRFAHRYPTQTRRRRDASPQMADYVSLPFATSRPPSPP
jgi:hypothetical protein